MPEVSVLIPCRNSEPWLSKAIASALECRCVAEVIVADDGSEDRSAAIAEGFGTPVRCLRLPARGGNAARNAAAGAARMEWLQFLDADDYLVGDKISRQFAEAGDPSTIDIIYSPVFIEKWNAGAVAGRRVSQIDTTTDKYAQWISWQLPQTGGALWRRQSLERIGGWNESMPCCQEHELYLRALQAGLQWRFCPSPGAVYRLWSETTVCRKDPVQVVRVRTALIDRMLSWLREQGLLKITHQDAAGQAFFEMARTWAQSDRREAARYLRERKAGCGIRLTGPAAPARYRIAYHLFGFRAAEFLARRLR